MTTAADGPGTQPPGPAVRLREYAQALGMPLRRGQSGVRALYELESTHNLLTERTLFRNLGYWANSPSTLDEACAALVDLVGERAGLVPGQRVLDAGFGFADQDLQWAARFQPQQIVGIDIIPDHLLLARRRIAAAGLTETIELRLASATAIPFPDGHFDRVVAVESAMHFRTRADFFREARRVLRPDGALVVAEPIAPAPQSQSRISGWLEQTFGGVPPANRCDRAGYTEALTVAGFVEVRVESIRDFVYPQFSRYLAGQLTDPAVRRRLNPLVRAMWHGWLRAFDHRDGVVRLGAQDYVLATARPGRRG
ncbi:SAM-dependent methyltransferase [Crossiella cryophila]|uniref:Ubiquinone/menaquinone biosynthesis C-methylase UbiE n=1 Tax=Crossiella cryophila TaxID=43355 RepID=A0A7W7FZR3_9PSEU|nr:class I SAM-dependent methyltransferase [Crossiella cryophila]MBB4681444.1 ubiquinone/menaquinone biosynthesis C-methylase UbiE [Crossiella cryophila]